MNRIKVFLINEISESLVHRESTHPAEDGIRIAEWRNCWIEIDNFLMVFIKFLRFYFHIHDNAKSQH